MAKKENQKKKQVISGERSIGIMGSRDLLVLKLVIGVIFMLHKVYFA